jgi:hypothetical protein
MTIKSTLAYVAVVAACLSVAPAHAEEESDTPEFGNILHMECTSPDSQVEAGCLMHIAGFLAGWSTAIEHIAQKTNTPAASLGDFCITEGSSLGDVRNTLVKGLEAMPDNGQHESGNVVMKTIFAQAYPCADPAAPAQ